MDKDTQAKTSIKKFEQMLISNSSKKEYVKSDKDIYSILVRQGNEASAIQLAKLKFIQAQKETDKPSEISGCTTVYKLIDEINKKLNKS